MTWKEFKDRVEAQGVRDEHEWLWIDVSNDDDGVIVHFDPVDGRFYIDGSGYKSIKQHAS